MSIPSDFKKVDIQNIKNIGTLLKFEKMKDDTRSQPLNSWWSFLKDISRSFEKYWERMNNDLILPILYVIFSIFPIIKILSNLFSLIFTSFLFFFSNFYSATVLWPLFFCVLILSQLSNSLTLGSRKKVNGHMHEQRQGVFLYLVD